MDRRRASSPRINLVKIQNSPNWTNRVSVLLFEIFYLSSTPDFDLRSIMLWERRFSAIGLVYYKYLQSGGDNIFISILLSDLTLSKYKKDRVNIQAF